MIAARIGENADVILTWTSGRPLLRIEAFNTRFFIPFRRVRTSVGHPPSRCVGFRRGGRWCPVPNCRFHVTRPQSSARFHFAVDRSFFFVFFWRFVWELFKNKLVY